MHGRREFLPNSLPSYKTWEHRNKVIFENEVMDPARIVQRTRDILAELVTFGVEGQSKVGRRGVDRRERENDGWRPAMGGVVKINVDAGVKEGEGVCTGVVCRDDLGAVLWGLTVAREADWDPRYAEAMAVYDGLEEAKRRGIREVVVESDCLQVVDALKERCSGRSLFSLLVDDILLLCSSFQSVVWSHTSRINNSVAHALAHVVPRTIGKTVWSAMLSPCANSAAVYDLSLMH
ncbi:uncharacterized protein LOC141617410 [Silene latifolia]|uniref:uncharacterized protein LOC141617410 n=1 Tax=Silene latifolia TaxID=37657 RepID=UPI003D78AD48